MGEGGGDKCDFRLQGRRIVRAPAQQFPTILQLLAQQGAKMNVKRTDYRLRDVFGVGRDVPLNYVSRRKVDDRFIDSLGRDKHIVVHGSSKQGKTTLRKHCLNDDDYIVISCLNKMFLADLHGAILKAAGYRIERATSTTTSGKWIYALEFKGEGRFRSSQKGRPELPRSAQQEVKTELKRPNSK